MSGLILLAVVLILTARRDHADAVTPAEIWHLARACGWRAVPLGVGRILCTFALVVGWSVAGLAWPATWTASRMLAGLALVLAAVAAHIALLYPPIPARQEAA